MQLGILIGFVVLLTSLMLWFLYLEKKVIAAEMKEDREYREAKKKEFEASAELVRAEHFIRMQQEAKQEDWNERKEQRKKK